MDRRHVLLGLAGATAPFLLGGTVAVAQPTGTAPLAPESIAEQTAVAQSLTSNFNPPPAPLTAAQQAAIASLQALNGPAFDEAYVKAQIQGHQQLLVFQQQFLAGDTDAAADFVHVALIATAFIETHLVLLQGLQYLAPL